MRAIEADQSDVTVDEIIEFAKHFKVDVRELLMEEYTDVGEEQILSNRYISLLRLYDQLSEKDKEGVIWVIKQRINGYI